MLYCKCRKTARSLNGRTPGLDPGGPNGNCEFESRRADHMDKEELSKFCNEGLSTRDIAKIKNLSQSSVKYWIAKFNLKTDPYSKTLKRLGIRKCTYCGQDDQKEFYGKRIRLCKKCHNHDVSKRGQEVKQKAREYLGNKCLYCNFDEHKVSLDIHHIDPNIKDPNFHSMRSWCWKRVLKEIQSCILLCKNCHNAYHCGLLDEEKYQNIIKNFKHQNNGN